MKITKWIFLYSVVLIILVEYGQSTFIAGTALYLFGNILARQMVKYVHKLAVQGTIV